MSDLLQRSSGLVHATLFGVALALIVAVSVGLLSFARPRPNRTEIDSVLVVVSAPNDKGEMAAQVIIDSSSAGGVIVSPETSVSVAGVSAQSLGDYYAFGGAAGVAELVREQRPATAGVVLDVTPIVWRQALTQDRTLQVTMPRAMDVFDGARYTSLPAGPQTLDSAELAALFAGISALNPTEREALRGVVGQAIVRALSESGDATKALFAEFDESQVDRLSALLAQSASRLEAAEVSP